MTLMGKRVDQLPRVALDHGHEPLLELAPAEGRGEQVAVRGVLLPLHLEDGPSVHRLELPIVVLAGERWVLEGPLDVLAAAQDPALGGSVVEEREVVPHGLVEGIGIGRELGGKDVGCGHGYLPGLGARKRAATVEAAIGATREIRLRRPAMMRRR